MSRATILVTAAAGNTGYPTALDLLEREHPVRAMVRRQSVRSQALRSRGAEVVVGSLDDDVDVRRALDGVQRAYFCPPLLPGLLDKAALFATAAEDHGLEFVVLMSQWLADPAHPSIHTRQSWLAERVFERMRGVGHAVVNPGWFADNYLAAPDLVSQFRVLPLPLGAGENAPPSNEDIGAVVAAILAEPEPHAGRTYRPTGPRLMSPTQLVQALSTVVGHRVRYLDSPPAAFGALGRALGLADYTTAQVLHYLQDYRRNTFGQAAPTDVVPTLTGRPAEDFTTIAARYLHGPHSRASVSGRAAALARLGRGMLRGVPRSRVLARPGDYALTHPSLAADSPGWQLSHQPRGGHLPHGVSH